MVKTLLAKKLEKSRFLTIKSTPTQKIEIFMNFKIYRRDQNSIMHPLNILYHGF